MSTGYRSGYRRGARRYPQAAGRVVKANARPGACRSCAETVPAGTGQLWREESGAWSVVHRPAEWAGSPVSGFYSGGCPDATDRQNDGAPWNRDGHVPSERERIAAVAATYAAMPSRQASTGGKYAYTNTGARVTMSSRRCEDAPCCGCCD